MNNDKFFAAIDLGTNSCRLLISDQSGKYVYKDTQPTKLGEGLQAEMKFTEAAIARGVNCFCNYGNKINEYGVCKTRAIATAACRMAENAQEFIAKVEERSGIKIEVIDGMEEARLNLKGAVSHVKGKSDYVVLYDLGGGSTEITLATNEDKPKIINTVSIPWGARNAAEAYGLVEYDEQRAQKLHEEIKNYTDNFVKNSGLDNCRDSTVFVATSSTPLRLTSMVKKLGKYEREGCDGLEVSCCDVDDCIENIYKMNVDEMAANPYVGEKRSTIFVAACVIFKTIYERLGAKSFTASLKSAKDGIIEEMVEKNKKTTTLNCIRNIKEIESR